MQPIIRYTKPREFSYEEFSEKFAAELLSSNDAVTTVYGSPDTLFDPKPPVELCPIINIPEWYTTDDVLQYFNLYVNVKFRTLMFHYSENRVVSLCGANMRRWFNKLGDEYFVNNPYDYGGLMDHLNDNLHIRGDSPMINNNISNHQRDVIGLKQEPIPGLPLYKAKMCSKCSFFTNGGFSEIKRHYKKHLGRNDGLRVDEKIAIQCFRQTLTPLATGSGIAKRYFLVDSPEDFFEREQMY